MKFQRTVMSFIGVSVFALSFWFGYDKSRKTVDESDLLKIPHTLIDTTLTPHDSLVISNAWKHYPASRPFLDSIVAANKRYSDIFKYPLEYAIGVHLQEATTHIKGDSAQPRMVTQFDSLAVSPYPAIGIGQFTRDGAKEVGMSVYQKKDAPELYDLEMRLREISNLLKINEDNRLRYLALHKPDSAMISQSRYEHFKRLLHKSYRQFRTAFIAQSADTAFQRTEKRINPWISIDRTAYKLAKDARSNLKHFNSDTIHAAQRALPSYNAGLDQTQKWYGLPNIPQTVEHYRMIKLYADTLVMTKIPKRTGK